MARAVVVLLLLAVACVCIINANASCPPNQKYDSCGPACVGHCGKPINNCIQVCTPGCHCVHGYVKNAKDQCVLPEDCK
ncbi:Chymotrypsin inhibitor [Anthophora retusa]